VSTVCGKSLRTALGLVICSANRVYNSRSGEMRCSSENAVGSPPAHCQKTADWHKIHVETAIS
jgi:hypothetical protein